MKVLAEKQMALVDESRWYQRGIRWPNMDSWYGRQTV